MLKVLKSNGFGGKQFIANYVFLKDYLLGLKNLLFLSVKLG